MLKIIIAIFFFICFCLSDDFESLYQKAEKSNKEILYLIELLETRPLITSISLQDQKFTLIRKDFRYNPGKYLGDIQNSLNERLPDEDNGYFDLGDTFKKYKKDHGKLRIDCMRSYAEGLEKLESFLKTTWDVERNLRSLLRISEKKYENTTIIEAKPKIQDDDSIFPQIKLDIPVSASAPNFINTIIGFIAERVEFTPIIELKKEIAKKTGKSKQEKKQEIERRGNEWSERW